MKKALVPELRFPEFLDAGEWKEIKLGQLGELVSGLTYSPNDVRDTGLLVLRSSNIQRGEIYLEDNVYVTPEVKGANLSKPNDILICVRNGSKALIGKNALVPEGMPVCTHGAFMTVFRSRSANFVFQLFQTSAYQSQVDADLGATINSINGRHFIKYEFFVPLEPEQQKIADCLSSIDELITAQTQKLGTLKAHKKGMMQQLFPAEGETVPKLRFPEFRDAGEWGGKPLKEVFSIFQGFAFSSKDSVTDGVRWLKIADVSIQQMNHNSPSFLPIEHEEKHNKFSVKQGDFVIALTRPILSKQLKMAPVDTVFHGALLNQRVGKLVTTQNIVFVYYLLQTSQLISDIEKSISGSEPPNLSAQQIEDINTHIPLENEQKKIANCLSSIDELITTQIQKIDSLKAHKKGLMQQLFPAMDEVTA